MKRLRVALIVVVAIVVVVVAAIEIGGRPVLQSYIRGQIVTSLPGTEPTVSIGAGSLTLQALSGHLDSIDVSVPDAPLGTLRSDLTVHAVDVPIDTSRPIPEATIGVDATAAQVEKLVRTLDGFDAASVTIDTDVSIGSTFTVFGRTIPFAIGLTPSASAGSLVLTPTSVTLDGAKVALADVKSLPLAADIVSLVKPQTLCVAQYLPAGISLSGVAVIGNHLHLTARGRNIELGSISSGSVGGC